MLVESAARPALAGGIQVVAAALVRAIPLDPEFAGEAGGWRDDKWGVDWPFPVEELEEAVRR